MGTHFTVGLASALFTVISIKIGEIADGDGARVAAQSRYGNWFSRSGNHFLSQRKFARFNYCGYHMGYVRYRYGLRSGSLYCCKLRNAVDSSNTNHFAYASVQTPRATAFY